MKRIAITLVAVLALALPALASTDPHTGNSRLTPQDQSGIHARVVFANVGSDLLVAGVAEGLVPGATYISLIYDRFALPGGPNACTPSGQPDAAFPVLVGVWTNNGDGTGELFSTVPVTEALTEFATVSIREQGGQQPNLRACGRIASKPLRVPAG